MQNEQNSITSMNWQTVTASQQKYSRNTKDIFVELIDMAFNVKQVFIVKLLNQLGSFFSTYLTILKDQVKNDKAFLKHHELLEKLENERRLI